MSLEIVKDILIKYWPMFLRAGITLFLRSWNYRRIIIGLAIESSEPSLPEIGLRGYLKL